MEENWSRNRCIIFFKIAGVVAIPAVLFFIPLGWLSAQPSICIYKCITGHECFGCGITRAVLLVLHFQYNRALELNKLIIIVFPILSMVWIKNTIKMVAKYFNMSDHIIE